MRIKSILAQTVLDFEESRKIRRFPKELFQTVETGETGITEIFRSAFDHELERRKYDLFKEIGFGAI